MKKESIVERIAREQMAFAVKDMIKGKDYINNCVTVVKFQQRDKYPNMPTKSALVMIELSAELN